MSFAEFKKEYLKTLKISLSYDPTDETFTIDETFTVNGTNPVEAAEIWVERDNEELRGYRINNN